MSEVAVIVWLLFAYNPTLPVANSEYWDGPYFSEKVCEAKKTIAEDGVPTRLGHAEKFKCVSFHRYQ